jgi:hypothetical protein
MLDYCRETFEKEGRVEKREQKATRYLRLQYAIISATRVKRNLRDGAD